MNRNKIILIAVIAVLIVLLAAGFVFITLSSGEAEETRPEIQTEPTITEPEEQTGETDAGRETVSESTEATELPETTVETEPEPPIPVVTNPENVETGIHFPYRIPDTELVIEAVKSYDGIYLEDGSDVEIQGVASIILRNGGSRCVEYAQLRLTGEKTTYSFTASSLDAGASMVVMEAGKAPAVSQDYLEITADPAYSDGLPLSEDQIAVTDTAEGLQVQNLTDRDIPVVRVFYKFYMEEQGVYVGGITYVAKLTDLKAGQSASVTPSHYIPGSSRVIMVKTYEKDGN